MEPERQSTSVDRLRAAFTKLDSYGIEARVMPGDDPGLALTRLLGEVRSRFPKSEGSCIFWLSGDGDCFDSAESLIRPLRLHHSGPDVARVGRLSLAEAGLSVVRDNEDSFLDVIDPSVDRSVGERTSQVS